MFLNEFKSFVKRLTELYPPPENSNTVFGDEDIRNFEKILGTELPSDYYEFLEAYGYGSFDSYFYVNNPFIENGTEIFLSENNEQKEIYAFLERDVNETINGQITFVDCKFVNGQPEVVAGNPELAETMRTEVIDGYTRSKIKAFGNHFPYAFYPDKTDGLIFIGHTDDEDFFYRYSDGRYSIVMYDADYYEFDMTFTEFVYNYLTKKIRLPMQNDDTDWKFIHFEE